MTSHSLQARQVQQAPALASWPVLVLCCTALLIFAVSREHPALGDPDTWWHLATGEWILAHRAVPSADIFSYVMRGAAWTPHEWLAELVMVGLHRAGGGSALVAMASLCYGLALAMVMRFLLRHMEPVRALGFTVMAGWMMASHLLARPHVLAWPLLALWFTTLLQAAESRRAPPWWLAAVMLLWANLHASHTLGMVLAAPIALEAALTAPANQRSAVLRRWGLFWLLCLAATLCTPHAGDGWLFTFYVMNLKYVLTVVGEWLSPNFHRLLPLEVFLLALLSLGLMGRLQLPWWRLLVLLGLVHLALKHARNSAMLGLLGPLWLAAPLGQRWSEQPAQHSAMDRAFMALAQPAKAWSSALLLACTLAAMAGLAHHSPRVPKPNVTPEQAVAAARKAGIKGPVFNAYNFGGYLIHQGIPVFMDGRSDMYGDEHVRRYVAAVNLHSSAALTQLLERYRIGWTLLAPGTPAVAWLDSQPGWRRLHADEVAVVHVRTAAGR